MKFKDKFPELAFKDEHDGDLDIPRQNLTSLEGCPKIINGSFYCSVNNLESLVGGPEKVKASYFCDNNQLLSLDEIAFYIGNNLSFEGNPIESIAGIHKKITYLGGNGIWIPSSCKNGVLDIFKMNASKLMNFYCGNENVNDIFEKYLELAKSGQLTKTQATLHCQSELIENNLDEYTEY